MKRTRSVFRISALLVALSTIAGCASSNGASPDRYVVESEGLRTNEAAVNTAAPVATDPYAPPGPSVSRLGSITELLKDGIPLANSYQGVTTVLKLPGGQLYYDSHLDLDSDGSRFANQDPTGQSQTSLHQPDGKSVDSDAVPYFVLPRTGLYQHFGIELGDVAALIYRDRVEFAVFADKGPKRKLGEGSIALHRSLGHDPIRNGRYHDEAIEDHVITIVFPRSGDGNPQTPDRVRTIGRDLFTQLGGTAP
jgi:hypothetical protein